MYEAPASPDTVLKIDTWAARLGIHTLGWRNRAWSGYRYVAPVDTGKRYDHTLTSDWVYNMILPPSNRFVTRDLALNSYYQSSLFIDKLPKNFLSLESGYVLSFQDYAANQTQWLSAFPFLKTRLQSHPQRWFTLRGGLGLYSDQRQRIRNTGYGTDIQWLSAWLSPDSSWQISTRFFHNYQRFAPRNNQHLHANITARKQLNAFAAFALRAGWQTRRVEDYLVGSIQSIVSDTIVTGLDFDYQIAANTQFRSRNEIALPNRSFNYRPFQENSARQNVFYDQQDLATSQEIATQWGRLSGSGRFEYRLRNRAYQLPNNLKLTDEALQRALANEQIKDIREATTAYIYQFRFIASQRDILTLGTNASLFRVDTRSELNTQDRDEILYTGEIGHEHRWSPFFRTTTKLYGSYRHFVYITATQSIENYKERILRLEPSFQYGDRYLTWKGDYSLFVTYHVRDFATEQLKNRANRIFIMTHNVQYRFNRNWAVLADLVRRENRLGLFDYNRFVESPLDTVIIYDATLKGQYAHLTPTGQWKLQLGYRYFRQTRSNLAGLSLPTGGIVTIALDNIILQHGPKIAFDYRWKQKLLFSFDLWLQTNHVFFRYNQGTTPFLGQSFSETDLKFQQRNLFPYFTVSASYRLY